MFQHHKKGLELIGILVSFSLLGYKAVGQTLFHGSDSVLDSMALYFTATIKPDTAVMGAI